MSDTTPIVAGASEADGAHNPVDDGSTPSPATTDDGAGPRPDVPADPSVAVNAQGQEIPIAHDALNPGAAVNDEHRVDGPLPTAPDGAQVNARHNHDGTTTDFNVFGCGEGRHLVEIRVPTPTPDGDVFRHAFSGDGDTFTINGLPLSGTATVTNLQGDGRPQDVGDVTAGQGAEIRFDVELLDPDAVTPVPDPGQGQAPSVAHAAVAPTAEELEQAQQQSADERAAGDQSVSAVTPGLASDHPASSGAGALGGAESEQPNTDAAAPPSLSLPGAVDVNAQPLPDDVEKPAKFADGDIPDPGAPSAPGGPDGRDPSAAPPRAVDGAAVADDPNAPPVAEGTPT